MWCKNQNGSSRWFIKFALIWRTNGSDFHSRKNCGNNSRANNDKFPDEKIAHFQGRFLNTNYFNVLAERVGFEPTVRQRRTLDFESSAFDHSATFPDSVVFLFHFVAILCREIADYSRTNTEHKSGFSSPVHDQRISAIQMSIAVSVA